jgi:hypothetical protein
MFYASRQSGGLLPSKVLTAASLRLKKKKGQPGDWNPSYVHQTSGIRRIAVANLQFAPFSEPSSRMSQAQRQLPFAAIQGTKCSPGQLKT